MSMPRDKWKRYTIQKIAGDSQVTRRTVCSFDSTYLLVINGCIVRVYSRKTGELLQELTKHTDTVTDVSLDRKDNAKAYSSSLDGQIAVWDFIDGGFLKSVNFGKPILRFCIRPSGEDPTIFLSLRNEQEKVEVFALQSTILSQHRTDNDATQLLLKQELPVLTLGNKVNELTFTFDSKYLVTSNRNQLVLYDVEREVSFRYSASSAICAVSCHPGKHCVATGTISGEIYLWYNYGSTKDSLVKTRFHWHAHAVADLCFSTDGTYLLSGGEESVLVLWQLATEQKHFRPRLGAPIVGVACCPGDQTFAVSLKNNSIQLVSGLSNKVTHSLVQLYRALPGLSSGECVPTGLVYDPRTNSLVLNGSPGHLQFYDFEKNNRVKSQLEVVSLNLTSRSDDKLLTPTTIDNVAFDSSGSWLATIENWDNGVISPVRKLKFWKFEQPTQSYVVNTCIEPPHQDRVSSLIFRPSTSQNESQPSLAVTTSLDGRFKIWECCSKSPREEGQTELVIWMCRSEGSYYSLPCLGCGFSEDGSLLALNFKKFVTVWDPLTCEHRKTFNSPSLEDQFRQVTFGFQRSSHLLLGTSSQFLHVWDLLKCEGVLTVPLAADVIVSNPYSDMVALFTSSELYIFNPRSPSFSPLAIHSVDSTVTSATFLPVRKDGQISSSQLYFINKNQSLFTLAEPEDIEMKMFRKRIAEDLGVEESRQLYDSLFGRDKTSKDSFPNAKSIRPARLKAFRMLDGPPHLLPPMSTLCKPFLWALLTEKDEYRINQDEQVKEKDSEEESEANDDDEEEEGRSDNDSSDEEGKKDIEDVSFAMETTKDKKEQKKIESDKVEVKDFDWLIDFFKTELVT